MAELVGLAAAIPQLLIYGDKARSHLSDMVEKASDAPQFVDDLSDQVEHMVSLTKLIYKPSIAPVSMDSAIHRCLKKLTRLKGLLDKVRFAAKDGKATRLEKEQMVLAWKLSEKSIERLWKQIDRELALLNFHSNVSRSIVEAAGNFQQTSVGFPCALTHPTLHPAHVLY